MRITILCPEDHPVTTWMREWARRQVGHDAQVIHDKSDLTGGDLLFLISCGQIIGRADRERYAKALVIHAADLPKGRGWSPHIWQIVEGADAFVVTLLEAEDKVDSGDIWTQERVAIRPDMLCEEINRELFLAELRLMDFAVYNFGCVKPRKQVGEPTYYRKRTPADGEIDPTKTLAEQFNLMRVADPERYPAFFRLHGHTYEIRLTRTH